jgi:hypothetical protein
MGSYRRPHAFDPLAGDYRPGELRLVDLLDIFLFVLLSGVVHQHVEAAEFFKLRFTASAQNLSDPLSPLMS